MTAVTAKPTWPNQPSLPAHFDAPSSRPGSNVLPPPATWAPVFGPSEPIWLPWASSISQIQEAQRAGTGLMDTGGTAVAPVLSSSEEDRAPSSKDQEKKDTENWGKLIFQLKQKHPEQGTIVGPFLWTRCLVSSYWSTWGDSDHGSSNSFSCFV